MRPSSYRCERAMIPKGAIPLGDHPTVHELTTQFTGALLGQGEEDREDWMKVDSRLEKPWRVFRIVADLNGRPLKQTKKFLDFLAFRQLII